jgi:hypothetical protein
MIFFLSGTSLVIWSWRWPFHSWLPALIRVVAISVSRCLGEEMDVTIREEVFSRHVNFRYIFNSDMLYNV